MDKIKYYKREWTATSYELSIPNSDNIFLINSSNPEKVRYFGQFIRKLERVSVFVEKNAHGFKIELTKTLLDSEFAGFIIVQNWLENNHSFEVITADVFWKEYKKISNQLIFKH